MILVLRSGWSGGWKGGVPVGIAARVGVIEGASVDVAVGVAINVGGAVEIGVASGCSHATSTKRPKAKVRGQPETVHMLTIIGASVETRNHEDRALVPGLAYLLLAGDPADQRRIVNEVRAQLNDQAYWVSGGSSAVSFATVYQPWVKGQGAGDGASMCCYYLSDFLTYIWLDK